MALDQTTQETTAIETLLRKFVANDPTLMGHMADDIDFRIDHFQDETDVSWQVASSLAEMGGILQRLGGEIFPKGTKALSIETQRLPQEGWMLTTFAQEFYYGLRAGMCTSVTLILSHETEGKVDYFRETVTNVVDLEATTAA